MNRADAPVAGWYPDPGQRTRLRWWDGSDWSDHRRVGPRPADLLEPGEDPAAKRSWSTAASAPAPGREVDITSAASAAGRAASGLSREDTSAIVAEVRRATRGELDRATSRLAEQAGSLRTQLEPMIQDYGRRFFRWARRPAVIAIAVYVLYVVATAQLQTSLFDWLGEQVDKVIDPDGS